MRHIGVANSIIPLEAIRNVGWPEQSDQVGFDSLPNSHSIPCNCMSVKAYAAYLVFCPKSSRGR